MKKIILFIALMTVTMSFAQSKPQASKEEIAKIIKEQSDGIITPAQKGVTTVYQDGTTVVKTVYNDIKSLSPKVESAIKSLSNELKTTTTALWNILVKQQLVWSIGFLILTLTSIFNWYLFYKRNLNIKFKKNEYITGQQDVYELIDNPNFQQEYYNKYKEYEGRSSWKDNWTDIRYLKQIKEYVGKKDILIPVINPNNTSFKYLHLIICIGLSGLSIYHFSDMLTGFINPEFGALKTIVEVATKLK